MKKVFLFFGVALILSKIVVLSSGCANQIPPMGGPRDSLPPMLVNVTPSDSVRNFQGKKITFVFDEYVQVDNPQQNLLVSPTPLSQPTVEGKLRSVVVTLRDTLEENTTYTLDFGNAIKDINEGNALRNFSYMFSTGPTLDSAELTGKVILAETGGVDSTLIVMLHRSLDDSAVIKSRPRYVARVDRTGSFRFANLAAGTYALYALKDESGIRAYQSKSQLFAFSDTPVVIPAVRVASTLKAYVEEIEEEGATTTGAPARRLQPGTTVQDNRLRLQTPVTDGQLGLLDSLTITFPLAPLKRFDSSLAVLRNDSFQVVPGYSWSLDTSNKRITLNYNFPENTGYNLVLEREFAEDTSGRKLPRTDTLPFRTRRLREYGTVKFRFLNLDLTRNPILQFVQGNEVKFTHVFTNRDFNSNLFQPGDYDLRIVFDRNRNGKWDPGEFFTERRQPEEVLPINRRITIKANWDNETDFTL